MKQHNQYFGLRSRRVITQGEMKAATVVVKNGRIVAVVDYDIKLPCEVDDLGNKVLMPGLVDSHVHINEPGRSEWEGFNTATQAAAAGGITTLVDMPLNCIPVTTTKAAFDSKLAAVNGKLWVDCGFWGGVIPQNIDQLPELLEAGVLGVKSFLIDSGIEEFPAVEAQDIKRVLPLLSRYNVPYLIHAELDKAQSPAAPVGEDYQSFLASRPKQWENDAVALMVELAAQAKKEGHDNKVHIVHLSSAEALDSITEARHQGLRFTAETCPHYLTVAAEDIPDGKTLFKCCPPIRENANRERLWQAVKDRTIDFIVSDHSPCTPQLKCVDSGDLEKAWGGICSLQFGLPLIWTEARQRGFTLVEVSRLMSTQTARFAGLLSVKGDIRVGFDADFVVFDDEAEYQISTAMIKHRHKISPYVGRTVTGRINRTYLRGVLVYADDEFTQAPTGRPLLRGRAGYNLEHGIIDGEEL